MTPKLIKLNLKKSNKKTVKKSIKRKIKKTKLKGGLNNNYMPQNMKPIDESDIIRNVRCSSTNKKYCIACKICGVISGTSHQYISHYVWCKKYNTNFKDKYYKEEYIENATKDWTEDTKRFIPFVGKDVVRVRLGNFNNSNNNN